MSNRIQGSSANGSHAAKRERSRSRSPRRNEDRLQHKRDIKDEAKDETQSSKSADNVGLGAKNRLKSISIQMKLGDSKKAQLPKPKMTVANVFNQDSDSEPEEMPAIARMRMKNIGRDTPTSSGPNSFGKTKHGFSDAKKLFEKTLKEAMESARADD
ncbi:PEST proteolytic signal-containing nuclear protein-like [Diabrotica undecimpunctata]